MEEGSAARGVQPLAGIRIVDISTVVMGPYATQILADLGAEVVVLEARDGDPLRRIGPGPVPGLSGVALNAYRNKRSLAIDLKHGEGREVALRLLASADALVTNLRPGPLGRLALSYTDVRAVNPSIVYCHAHGWSAVHERAAEPAYDDVIQAASGVPDLMERITGTPYLFPTVIADKVSGLSIAYAVCAGLVQRAMHGAGCEIEVPMTDVMASFMLVEHGAASIEEPPRGPTGYPRILTPNRRPVRAADGLVYVMPYAESHWRDVLELAGRHDLTTADVIGTAERRHASSDRLYGALHEAELGWTVEQWVGFCRDRDIPCTPVQSLQDLVASLPVTEHPTAGRYRHIPPPVRFGEGGQAEHPMSPAPRLGQDTIAILAELGYEDDEVRELIQARAVFAERGAEE